MHAHGFFNVVYKRHTPYNYLSRYVKGGDQGSRLVLWVTYESVATLGVMYKDKITNIKSDTPGHVNRGETAEEHRAIEKMVKAAMEQLTLWTLNDLNQGGN